MKSLLEQTDELDKLISRLRKMESMMRSGQFIQAWRECNRLMANVEKSKRELIKEAGNDE